MLKILGRNAIIKMRSNRNRQQMTFVNKSHRKGPLALLILAFAVGLLLTAHCLLPTAQASDPGSGDWPMWGGTPDRNMTSNMKGLPIDWDVKTKKNVKWVAQLGS